MKYLSYAVMIYMLLALIWWAVLLSKNNKAIYELQLSGVESVQQPFQGTMTKEVIHQTYQRNQKMIIGEGIVFGVLLIIGMWFIQKSYNNQVGLYRRQKNFLLSISHELKSPITSIKLIMDTLMSRQLEEDKQKELYQSVHLENLRLEHLIHNLLFATRIDKTHTYIKEPLDIVEVVDGIVQKYALYDDSLHIEAQYTDQPMYVEGDRETLISLFGNVVENAIKYSEGIPEISVIIKGEKDKVVIKIADKGIGIPDGEKNLIFGQFYRIGNEETRGTKGTGLGLYIANKVALAHQGQIFVRNNEPKGSIFIIHLPIIK